MPGLCQQSQDIEIRTVALKPVVQFESWGLPLINSVNLDKFINLDRFSCKMKITGTYYKDHCKD